MITNPSLLSYTCIAKGTVVLAEFASSKEDPGIEDVALRCIENTPPHHSTFSHTVRKKTYTFSIDDDSLVYFAILDEAMEKHESFWLLNRLRSAVEDLVRGGGETLTDPSPRCLQSKMDPVFAEIVGGGGVDLELDMDLVGSPRSVARESRNPSIDSSKGRRASLIPLLGKQLNALKKKNKRLHSDDSGDVGTVKETSEKKKKVVDLCGKNGNGGVSRKELRNGLLTTDHHHHRQKAKQMWKKHVWVVLLFDICICAVLFGIWLWVCEGFQCVNG